MPGHQLCQNDKVKKSIYSCHHMQGTGTADVRLQEAHVGPGSNADALAAWKAGDTTDTGYPHPSSLPGALITGKPIIGMLHMVKGCINALENIVLWISVCANFLQGTLCPHTNRL